MDVRRTCLTLAVVGFALAAGFMPARALTPGTRAALPGRQARPARVLSIDNQRRVDINNLNMFITNYGSYAYDLSTGNSGLVYPKGTTKTACFAAGLWLGAQVNNQVRVTVAEYSQEFGPGIILPDGHWDNAANPAYKSYKVARFTGNLQDTAHVDRAAADLAADPLADPLVHHSWSEYMQGAAPYGAPVRTYRLPGALNPADSVDIQGPDVLGDQMVWAVYNDADPSRHTNSAGLSAPLNVEVRQTTFAFNRTGALGNTIFFRWQIIHPASSTETLDNMFVSMWADPDLGGSGDDLVGCDTTLSLGYVYNATNNDQLYGSAPPALGWDFFLGPKVGSTTLGMTSFNKYINGTDPTSAVASYNYMQGLQADGSELLNEVTGEPTTFFDSGDPVTQTGWLDQNPADKRLQLSSGPFTMVPGDTQVVVGAMIVGQGGDRLASITGLKFFDQSAQQAFDLAFNLPPPPPQPKVVVNANNGQIELSWDSASQFSYTAPPGYAFEGYNVYQGATIAGPWRRLATYDIVNGIRVVRDTVFDQNVGQLITDFPTAFGGDNGLAYEYTTTQDAVNGGPLRNGTVYYFAVTAYSVGLGEKPRVLENPQTPVAVIPQNPPSGTDVSTAAGVVTHVLIDSTLAPGTDEIIPKVVDPTVVTGHVYKIFFTPVPGGPTTVQVGPDTATVLYTWSLKDSTTGSVLLSNQLNRRGDGDYQVVDGIQWIEKGNYFPALQSVSYLNDNPAHRRALTGVNFGFSQDFFFGGAEYGFNFLGGYMDPTVMPDSFTTVDVRFSHTQTQKAYRYLREQIAGDPSGAAPPTGRGYVYAGFHEVPFQVWDTVNNIQLDVGFVERGYTDANGTLLPLSQQPASQDSTWDPSDDAEGDREYIIVYHRPYSDTPKAELAVNGGPVDGGPALLPVEYVVLARKRAASDVIDDGDVLEFLYANPSTANDVYIINTSQLQRGNVALEKAGLDHIRVVPNPYYNHSNYEPNQFTRVVRFMNMPERATVRIFNLSGKLVRTLSKTDPTTSVLNWDLQTNNQLPIASGIYVYHVDVPGVGSTFGKLVVFMEKERLNTF